VARSYVCVCIRCCDVLIVPKQMIPVKFCTVFVCYMIKVTGSNRLLFLLLTLHRSYLLTDNDIISVHFNSGEKWLQSTTVTLNSNLSGSEPLHSLVSMLLYPLITVFLVATVSSPKAD